MATVSASVMESLSTAYYVDLNSLIDVDGRPDLLPDVEAVNNRLYNLFRCPVGARGPIFSPEFGTNLLYLIHDPMDNETANNIRMYSIQAIARWMPDITLDTARMEVRPIPAIQKYSCYYPYTINRIAQQGEFRFSLKKP